MDIRTYPHDADSDVDAEQMTHFDPIAELNAYAAENARLRNELDLRIRQLMDVSRHCGQLLTANEELRNELAAMEAHWRNAEGDATTAKADAAELSKALDMCIAERDGAFAEVDALRAELLGVTNARDFLRASLHTERTMRTAELDAHRRELDALRDELDTQAKRHAEIIDQWKAEENMWRYYDKKQLAQIDALRAELDAMRQAHSVIAARMEAMGC